MNLDFDKRLPFTNCRIVGDMVNPNDYHAEQVMRGMPGYVITRSSLLAFNSCPKKWINGWRVAQSESTEWGSLIDCLVLTPSRFEETYAVEPSTYPAPKDCTAVKKGKCKEGDPIPWDNKANYCKDWSAAQDGKEVISAKLYESAKKARSIVQYDDLAMRLITNCQKQLWVEGDYFDAATKLTIKVKTLIDLVPGNGGEHRSSLADFKTTRSAHPRTWAKMVTTYGYDCQAAMTLDLYSAATGQDRNTFLHIIQENVPPYQTARRILSMELVALGRMKVLAALERYCRCLKSNHWPDWDEGGQYSGWSIVEMEAWMLKDLEANANDLADPQTEEETEEGPLVLN